MTAPGKVGTVKCFDAMRGFGFISCADGSEIYFHATGIEPGTVLAPGDRVKFIEGFARDGRTRARNVVHVPVSGRE
jgi:cold shock CspA family protein